MKIKPELSLVIVTGVGLLTAGFNFSPISALAQLAFPNNFFFGSQGQGVSNQFAQLSNFFQQCLAANLASSNNAWHFCRQLLIIQLLNQNNNLLGQIPNNSNNNGGFSPFQSSLQSNPFITSPQSNSTIQFPAQR